MCLPQILSALPLNRLGRSGNPILLGPHPQDIGWRERRSLAFPGLVKPQFSGVRVALSEAAWGEGVEVEYGLGVEYVSDNAAG